MRFLLTAAAALVLIAAPAVAECPCVPVTHLWVVKTCSDWNCAQTELLLANGDPQVFAIPVSIDDLRWLVVRRIASGTSIPTSDADPFAVEQFDHFNDAVDRYGAIDSIRHPIMVNAPDGETLVIAMKPSALRQRGLRRQ